MMVYIRTVVLTSLLCMLVPAASFAGTGVLEIHSEPSGARVIIDGTDAGTTPYQNIDMPTGKHQVKAMLGPEYPPLVQEVVITELSPQVIMFKFIKQKKGTFVGEETVLSTEQLTGNAIFVSMPTGASVVIDGLPSKSTPIGYTDIEVGKYPVKFILGERVLHSNFEVVRGETIKVIADFNKGRVFSTAEEAKKRAAKKKTAKREMASHSGTGRMAPSPEPEPMETLEPEVPEVTGEERATAASGTEASSDLELEAVESGASEEASPSLTTAGTRTPETAAPPVMSAGTRMPEPAAGTQATAGRAGTEGAVTAMQTPQPEVVLPPASRQPMVSNEVSPPAETWPTPFGELAISVDVSRDAGLKYSDYFILSFPKIPIQSLSGSLFPDAAKIDQSVQRGNFEYANDAYIEARWFTARVHFDPRMTVRAESRAQSDIMTVKQGTYDLEITRRRIVKHFVPDEKILDKTAREPLEIVPGKRLLVQIDGTIGKDNELNYEIKKTYESMAQKKKNSSAEQQGNQTRQGRQHTDSSRALSTSGGNSSASPLSILHGGQD
jgi:hypothetical protein